MGDAHGESIEDALAGGSFDFDFFHAAVGACAHGEAQLAVEFLLTRAEKFALGHFFVEGNVLGDLGFEARDFQRAIHHALHAELAICGARELFVLIEAVVVVGGMIKIPLCILAPEANWGMRLGEGKNGSLD